MLVRRITQPPFISRPRPHSTGIRTPSPTSPGAPVPSGECTVSSSDGQACSRDHLSTSSPSSASSAHKSSRSTGSSAPPPPSRAPTPSSSVRTELCCESSLTHIEHSPSYEGGVNKNRLCDQNLDRIPRSCRMCLRYGFQFVVHFDRNIRPPVLGISTSNERKNPYTHDQTRTFWAVWWKFRQQPSECGSRKNLIQNLNQIFSQSACTSKRLSSGADG